MQLTKNLPDIFKNLFLHNFDTVGLSVRKGMWHVNIMLQRSPKVSLPCQLSGHAHSAHCV